MVSLSELSPCLVLELSHLRQVSVMLFVLLLILGKNLEVKTDCSYLLCKTARQCCHRHFWRFTHDLQDEDHTRHVTHQFTEEEPHLFFANTYHSSPTSMSNLPECPLLIILQWSSTLISFPLRRFKQSSNDPNKHPLFPLSIKSHTRCSRNSHPSA